MKKHDVEYGEIQNRFYRHIELEHNNQIFFSGKYGTGKSTFLSHFFDEKPDEFYRIHLSPVNYVVTSNENIFDLIKVDIIRQLYNDNQIEESENTRKGIISSIKHWAVKDPVNLVKYALKAVSKLHPIAEAGFIAAEGVSGLIEELKKYEDEINGEQAPDNQLMDFALSMHNISGTHIENDIITRIIQKKIEKINQTQKKSVLIIDDLDRLDPEHIFRILNILSSHDNHNEKSHKFNFNKVILVADIDNIHNIFKHRYGEKTDFDGYIDKFYNHEIFYFSNDDALVNHIENKLNIGLRQEEKSVLILLLKLSLKHQKITLRKIIKYKHFQRPERFRIIEIIWNSNSPHFTKDLWVDSDDIPLFYIIPMLTSMFGSFSNLKKVISELESDQNNCDFHNLNSLTYVLKSFVLFKRYLEAISKKDRILFFFKYWYDDFTEENKYNSERKDINGELLRFPYIIDRKWGKDIPYTGDKSYFEECGITVNIDSGSIKNSEFILMITEFINFIEKNNFKTKLNITS